MPRFRLDTEFTTRALRVLDKDGEIDESVAPDVDDDLLGRMYRAMLRARRFDERLLTLQRQGDVGTFAPIKGQEASQIGAVACIDEEDWLIPAFRETAAMLWRGTPMSQILLFNAGFNEGAAIPEEKHDFPIAVPVASQLPHAVGIAYAAKLRGDSIVAMTFFGDGATSEGDFHEAMNFAAVFELPVVFVCQNNQWAISVPRERQTRSRTLAQKAIAYGMPGSQVDGNDVLAVYSAAEQAVQRARDGDGPTLIECVTYRMEVHTTADDPSRYRDDEEVEKWADRDPIERFRVWLGSRNMISNDDIESLEDDIENEIDDAWTKTQESIEKLAGNPAVMFDHHFAEMPPTLNVSEIGSSTTWRQGETRGWQSSIWSNRLTVPCARQ